MSSKESSFNASRDIVCYALRSVPMQMYYVPEMDVYVDFNPDAITQREKTVYTHDLVSYFTGAREKPPPLKLVGVEMQQPIVNNTPLRIPNFH